MAGWGRVFTHLVSAQGSRKQRNIVEDNIYDCCRNIVSLNVSLSVWHAVFF